MNYTSQLIRNRIPVMVSNKEKVAESSRVAGKVEDDRRYTVEACIIKVMKARKTIEMSQLMIEVIKLLSQKFKADSVQIK
jgi:cullin 3